MNLSILAAIHPPSRLSRGTNPYDLENSKPAVKYMTHMSPDQPTAVTKQRTVGDWSAGLCFHTVAGGTAAEGWNPGMLRLVKCRFGRFSVSGRVGRMRATRDLAVRLP